MSENRPSRSFNARFVDDTLVVCEATKAEKLAVYANMLKRAQMSIPFKYLDLKVQENSKKREFCIGIVDKNSASQDNG
ncbi:hypothetical protein ACSQ67_011118 [Phaseolus vulgaris]